MGKDNMETNHIGTSLPGQSWVLVTDRLPDVKPKHRKRFLVAVRFPNGRIFTQVAAFVKDYWLEWSDDYMPENEDDIDDNNGQIWNGWMEDRLSTCGDEVSQHIEGEAVAWMLLPEYVPGSAASARKTE